MLVNQTRKSLWTWTQNSYGHHSAALVASSFGSGNDAISLLILVVLRAYFSASEVTTMALGAFWISLLLLLLLLSLLLLLQRSSSKNPRLCRFKSDQDEIWQFFKYICINISRKFGVSAKSVWTMGVLSIVTSSSSLSTFKRHLKTYLFATSYWWRCPSRFFLCLPNTSSFSVCVTCPCSFFD